MFHFSTEVRVRLPETDSLGVVFHGWFFTYMEVGRMDYLRNLGLTDGILPTKGFSSVIVHASCDFRSPARFDDPLVVKVRVSEIGRCSFTFEFEIHHKQQNRLVATGKTVHCAVDEKTWKPIPVPEAFRRTVRAFEGASLVERHEGPERAAR